MSSSSEQLSKAPVYTRRNILMAAALSATPLLLTRFPFDKTIEATMRMLPDLSSLISHEKQGWELPDFFGISDEELAYHKNSFHTSHIDTLETVAKEPSALHALEFSLETQQHVLYTVDAHVVPKEDHRHTVEARIFKNGERIYSPVTLIAPLLRTSDRSSVTMNLWPFGKGDYRIELLQEETSIDPLAARDIKEVSLTSFREDSLLGKIIARSPIIAVDLERVRDVDNDGMLATYAKITKNSEGNYLVGIEFVASGQRRGTPPKEHRDLYGQDTDSEWMAALLFTKDGQLLDTWYQGHRHQKKPFRGERIAGRDVEQTDYGNNNFNDQVLTTKWNMMIPDFISSYTSLIEYLSYYSSLKRLATQELEREGKLLPDGTPK